MILMLQIFLFFYEIFKDMLKVEKYLFLNHCKEDFQIVINK